MRIALISLLINIFIVTGCSINPVTGKSQFLLVSQSEEIAIGTAQYPPSQQSQGGAYLIDKSLNSYVDRIGQTLATHSAQPELPYEFVVLNNSIPNAWALPGGKIAINRGLLLLLEDEAQLAAVLGHEIVHAAARHGAEGITTNFGVQILTAVVQSQTENSLYRQAAALGGGGFQAHYSRENELEADHYGINYMVAAGYNPQGAVELQQKLLSLSKDKGQSDWLSKLFASHPPSQERVTKNQQHSRQHPTGKRNKAAFLQATKQLRKDKIAYEKHQQAQALANKKQWNKAIALNNQAIKRQPKEARFHITQGLLLAEKQQNKSALAAFTRATKLEPSYFAPFYYRGLLYQEAQQYAAAQKDFLMSNRLFETPTANFYLGEIALANKQRQSAIAYYKKAAQAGGKIGKAATSRLQSLGAK